MQVEQNPARRHCDRNRYGGGNDGMAHRPRERAPDDQCSCGVEGGRRRRMPARERRPERGRGGIECRTDTADEVFDAALRELHAGQDAQQEEKRPVVSAAEQIGEHEHEAEHRNDSDVPELRDREETAC